MRVLRDKQVGIKKVNKIVRHDEINDEFGNIIEEAYDEEIEIDVPVYERVYEEVDEVADIPHEELPQMPTEAERIEALEMAMLELLEVVANG